MKILHSFYISHLSSHFSPFSEYDASYVEFPVQAKPKSYAPPVDSSPIPLQTAANCANWKSVNHVEYVDFSNAEGATNGEPMAGMPPDEDVGKSAPSYFAWSEKEEPTIVVPMKPLSKAPKAAPLVDYPLSPSPQKSVASASSAGNDSMAAAVTETQDSYGWNDVSMNHPVSSHNDLEFDPNFLADNIDGDALCWKTETQYVNEAMERAKYEGGLDPTTQVVCGIRQSTDEIYPLGFAWNRSSPGLDDSTLGEKLIIPTPVKDTDDILASAEDKKLAAPMVSEYDYSYTASTAVKAKKIAQKETRLQMGLAPEDMDASKWKSEYDTACEGYKASLYRKPETPQQLKKRKPLKRPKGGRRGATLRPRPTETVIVDQEEVDGFVVVDLEDSMSATEKASQKNDLERKSNNVYACDDVDPGSFKSEYEVQYAWPDDGSEPVTQREEKQVKSTSKGKQLLKLLGQLHPPYALDDDDIPPVKTGRKSYHLSLESPLNLFEEMEDIEVDCDPIEVVVTPPYACTDSKVDLITDSDVGTHKIYKGRGPQPPNVPDSEYHDKFIWGPGAEKLMDMNPNGIANKKKHILHTAEKNIQFTVGGAECDWEKQVDLMLQKRRAISAAKDVENEDVDMDVTNSMVAAINAGKVKSAGNMGISKAPPVKITKMKPSKGTRKVDNALIEANENAKARRANAVMKSAAKKAERDYQYSKQIMREVNIGKENVSVASDLSDMSPIKHVNKPPLPFRPSTGKSNRRVQKITPVKHGNPILKNKRYPNASETQSSRWKSETKLQFTNRSK